MRKGQLILFFIFLLFSANVMAQFRNGTAQDFSIAKLQYKEYDWRNYEMEKFRVHFYGYKESEQLAEQLVHATDSSLKRLETYFDTKLDEPLDVVLFTSYEDYLYSNVGDISMNENNIGGAAPVERFRAMVYANGNYKELVTSLNEQIAKVFLNNIFFGGNWRDALKNSTLLDLPEWYIEGLKSFLACEWNSAIDNTVRKGILTSKFNKLNRLKGDEAKYAGHAVWKFVADVYGENVIPNIIYLTRVSSNIESGFAYVIGSNLGKLQQDYFNYFTKRYGNEAFVRNEIPYTPLDVKLPKNAKVLQFTLSPDQQQALAVLRKDGKFRVELIDVASSNSKKKFKTGRKYIQVEDDYAPVVVWNPNSDDFVIFYKKKTQIMMRIENLKGDSDEKVLPELEKVISASYSPDGKKMAISSLVNGQSDIFLYTALGNGIINLTADIYSDIQPSFSKDGEYIYFSSDRHHTFTYDVFKINKEGRNLEAITNTPNINEYYPVTYKKVVSFIADNNGLYNRFYARKDSTIRAVDTTVHYYYFTTITPISNLPLGILQQQPLNDGSFLLEIPSVDKGRYFIAKQENDKEINPEVLLNSAHINLLKNAENIKNSGGKKKTKIGEGTIKYEKEVVTINEADSKPKKTTEQKKQPPKLSLPSAQMYERDVMISQVVSQLDNSFMNPIYQYYNPNGYYNPGLNTTLKVCVQDVFDDYAYEGGVRFPFNFDSNEFFFKAENNKKKINRGINVYRTTIKDVILEENKDLFSKTHIYEFTGWAAKPLSLLSDLKLEVGTRYQSQASLGVVQGDLIFPDVTLGIPTALTYKGIARLSYTFNNSYSPHANTRFGTRVKVFGELYNDLSKLSTRTIVAGLDARHYQKIVKDIVWASRLSFSTSLGQQNVMYYLGGVENWLFPKYDNSTAHSESINYTFQTLGVPMRGFIQNARNGNSFAVLNTELRLPLFRTLSTEPIKSEFLYHFQVIGFADMGTAWTGFDPYDSDNSFNVKIVEDKNIVVKIKNNQEPMVYGYGFGVRSKLFGYHVRLDWAWGIDDSKVKTARYLSIALDF